MTTDPMPRTLWGFSRGVAVVYGTAALFWLGMAMWGLLGDCPPSDFHGHCGFSMIFGGAIGLAGAFVLIAVGAVLQGRSRDFLAGDEVERFWLASATAVMAGIAALIVCAVVRFIFDAAYPVQEAVTNGLGRWPLAAFLGAPGACAIVFVVAAASDRRVGRSGRVSASRASCVGAAAGMVLGLTVGLQWADSALGSVGMMLGGLWTGAVVGWVFWSVALRGQVRVEGSTAPSRLRNPT